MQTRKYRLVAAALLISATHTAVGQVSMPQSPISGNPALLTVSFDTANTGEVILLVNNTPGAEAGSCYLRIQRHLFGVRIMLYDTSQGYVGDYQYGNIGAPQVLSSTACSIDLNQSSRPDSYTFILHVQLANYLQANNQVVSFWQERDCTYGCSWAWTPQYTIGYWNSSPPPPTPAQITSPLPNAYIATPSTWFSWTTGTGVSQYSLSLGTSPGTANLGAWNTMQQNIWVPNLPQSGETVYSTLWSQTASGWLPQNTSYFAPNIGSPAQLTSHTDGATLTPSSTVTFSWNAGSNVRAYRLIVGTTAGGGNLFDRTFNTQSAAIQVPPSAQFVFVTLESYIGSGTQVMSYSFRVGSAGGLLPKAAQILGPSPGSTIQATGQVTPVTFTWSAGTGASEYYLAVGKGQGSAEIFSGRLTATSQTLNLSMDGRPVFVRLLSRIGGDWQPVTARYETPNLGLLTSAAVNPAVILGPDTQILLDSDVTFSWGVGAGVTEFWLTVGTTPGGNELFDSYNASLGWRLSQMVRNIPSGTGSIYVTLYSRIGGFWYSTTRTYSRPTPTIDNPETVDLTAFQSCIASSGTAANPKTCTLPAGRVYLRPDQAGSGVFSGISYRKEISFGASYLTVTGNNKTRLVRIDGCKPMLYLQAGVKNVIVKDLEVHGSSGTQADTCLQPTEELEDGTVVLQPKIEDVEVRSFAGQGAENVTFTNVLFRESAGRSLVANGSGLVNFTVSSSRFYDPALTGLWVGSAEVAANLNCDTGVQSGWPSNVQVQQSYFEGAWTGAIAFNTGSQFSITGTSFFHNYWKPYDKAGGTVFIDNCAHNTTISGSYFQNSRLGLNHNNMGIEIWGRAVTIQNTQIYDSPGPGIMLNSAAEVTISGSAVQDNSRIVGPSDAEDFPGIMLQNWAFETSPGVLTRRRNTGGIAIQNNTINNTNAEARQSYGIKIFGCRGPGCTNTVATPIPWNNNYFTPNRVGDACAAGVVRQANPTLLLPTECNP